MRLSWSWLKQNLPWLNPPVIKIRVQLSDQLGKRFNKVQERLELDSPEELVRTSWQLCETLIEELDAGNEVVIIDKNGVKRSAIIVETANDQ